MPADLIVYALVAAGLVFWLRSILGTRHGEERPRSEAFMSGDAQDVNVIIDQISEILTKEDEIRELAKTPHKNYAIDNKNAESGLIDISRADKGFDVHVFLQGAQDAFVMIVESFAEGDRTVLRDLLGDEVYGAFEGAITEREKQNHTQTTDIHAIRNAEVIAARLEDKTAMVTIRFTAEESSVTKDKDGKIISGNADKISEMKDIWTFNRNVKSKDPSWLVVETRGGFDDDNEFIPDSH